MWSVKMEGGGEVQPVLDVGLRDLETSLSPWGFPLQDGVVAAAIYRGA